MKKNNRAGMRAPQGSALWDGAKGYMRVILRDVEVEARVGLHPWERYPERPSRLIVNVELFTHASPARTD